VRCYSPLIEGGRGLISCVFIHTTIIILQNHPLAVAKALPGGLEVLFATEYRKMRYLVGVFAFVFNLFPLLFSLKRRETTT
jgi:hypothetical protein